MPKPPVDLHALGRVVLDELTAQTGLPLDRPRATATPVLNWGGFGCRSFTVQDGRVAYHVKLSEDPENLADLARWRQLAPTLTERYRAPRARGWLELAAPRFAGLVPDRIEAETPERIAPATRALAIETIATLHDDHGLRERLLALGDPIESCAAAYRRLYHRRFLGDPRNRRRAPPFVPAGLLDWMAEAALLGGWWWSRRVFQEPADRPVHGDLWLNNLLVTAAGDLFIVDWDDLRLSDPMIDWTILDGPNPRDQDLPRADQPPAALPASPSYESDSASMPAPPCSTG
ncbi:MAG: phosphotransferase [Gemmatimonadales bacterium]